MVSPYWQAFHSLRGVYLEQSRVLSVRATRHALVFGLDVILTPSHPAYRGPAFGQDHDYRIATLELAGDQLTFTSGFDAPPIAHIDAWTIDGEGWSDLYGAWGRARLLCISATVTLQAP